MRALLLAAWLVAPSPQGLGRVELDPARGEALVLEDGSGAVVATAQARGETPTVLYVPPGEYVLRGPGGTRSFRVEAGAATSPVLAGPLSAPSPGTNADTAPAPNPSDARLPQDHGEPTEPPAAKRAWRAPLMSAFVPGLGHAWAGEPGAGIGLLVATAGSIIGATLLGVSVDRTDGATASDAARSPGYARLGGFAALSSIAGALYVGQIFDAHRAQKGEELRPDPGVVQLRFDRLTSVSMAAGRPRAGLYDDFSLAALVRVAPRVRVGLADASLKLGPEQTVLQLGARAMAQVYGPNAEHRTRRLAIGVGGGLIAQSTTRRRVQRPLDPDEDPTLRAERVAGAIPYALAEARVFVAQRWWVGALGRFGVPLTQRRYAGGQALPAFAPTLELGVSLGVNL